MDKLGRKLVSIENKLGGSEPVPANVQDPLGWHLNYIESLIEQGGGEGGDISSQIDISFEPSDGYVWVVVNGPIGKLIQNLKIELEGMTATLYLDATQENFKAYPVYETSRFPQFIPNAPIRWEVSDSKNEIKVAIDEEQYYDEYYNPAPETPIIGVCWSSYKGLATQWSDK